jgi:hypothetical protein
MERGKRVMPTVKSHYICPYTHTLIQKSVWSSAVAGDIVLLDDKHVFPCPDCGRPIETEAVRRGKLDPRDHSTLIFFVSLALGIWIAVDARLSFWWGVATVIGIMVLLWLGDRLIERIRIDQYRVSPWHLEQLRKLDRPSKEALEAQVHDVLRDYDVYLFGTTEEAQEAVNSCLLRPNDSNIVSLVLYLKRDVFSLPQAAREALEQRLASMSEQSDVPIDAAAVFHQAETMFRQRHADVLAWIGAANTTTLDDYLRELLRRPEVGWHTTARYLHDLLPASANRAPWPAEGEFLAWPTQ